MRIKVQKIGVRATFHHVADKTTEQNSPFKSEYKLYSKRVLLVYTSTQKRIRHDIHIRTLLHRYFQQDSNSWKFLAF